MKIRNPSESEGRLDFSSNKVFTHLSTNQNTTPHRGMLMLSLVKFCESGRHFVVCTTFRRTVVRSCN